MIRGSAESVEADPLSGANLTSFVRERMPLEELRRQYRISEEDAAADEAQYELDLKLDTQPSSLTSFDWDD